ncbi:uncharacterized protein LOC142606210 [Castanea sativa]|uniref:uncharacterized protein LOC142606210 n=1 Tax=Castanea sativa TaxID=21020 RepID=UPI003F64FD78
MDKSWMKKQRGSMEYIEGLLNFVEFASEHASDGKIFCPCTKCVNLCLVPPGVAREHLWRKGMLQSYTHWKWHGESADAPTATECGSSHVQDSLEQYGDFRGMLHDLCPTHEMPPEPMQEGERVQQQAQGQPTDGAQKFYNMIDDVDKPLYADAKLPKDHYKAKKIVRDLGLGYEKIHACPNDWMLFWKENVNLEACPCCKVSRWKTNEASVTGNNASSSKGKKKAAKILRWFPLKSKLQRLFLSPDLASSMKWHVNGRTDDEFSFDPRNVRLGLTADGFNPFGILSTTHSTWPVMLVPYNLSPWLCMKWSSLILSLVIPSPKSLGIAIDVYLQPLVEELRELWDVGVEAYDASSKNVFQVHAALMWTIHDFPAYADVSG